MAQNYKTAGCSHRAEQPVRIAVGEARHSGMAAMHAEPVPHGRVGADPVVLLDVATAGSG